VSQTSIRRRPGRPGPGDQPGPRRTGSRPRRRRARWFSRPRAGAGATRAPRASRAAHGDHPGQRDEVHPPSVRRRWRWRSPSGSAPSAAPGGSRSRTAACAAAASLGDRVRGVVGAASGPAPRRSRSRCGRRAAGARSSSSSSRRRLGSGCAYPGRGSRSPLSADALSSRSAIWVRLEPADAGERARSKRAASCPISHRSSARSRARGSPRRRPKHAARRMSTPATIHYGVVPHQFQVGARTRAGVRQRR